MYTKETIRTMLETNDLAVERGVIAIYKRQTDVEKLFMDTESLNGEGFNKMDADILSSFAERMIKYGRRLSTKQLAVARKRMLKYSGQLAIIANRNVQVTR